MYKQGASLWYYDIVNRTYMYIVQGVALLLQYTVLNMCTYLDGCIVYLAPGAGTFR